jgi:2-iminobutanoate/2-iminopropanoate deaminase
MTTILTPNAPQPIGPYSQAIREGDFLFCSGQIALDPISGAMKNASIEEETKQVLANVSELLKAGGASFSSLIKTTIFLTDMNDFAKVNEVYAQALGDAKPARSTVAVSALPKGARIEIECIAKVQ